LIGVELQRFTPIDIEIRSVDDPSGWFRDRFKRLLL